MKPYDRRLLMYRVALTALVGVVLLLFVAYQQKQRELDAMRRQAQTWEAMTRALDQKIQNDIRFRIY
jgi:hypothetical protein